MSIYSKNGQSINSAYLKNGQTINAAFSVSGNSVFPDGNITLKVMTYNVGQWYIGGGDNVPADKDSSYYALQNGMIEQNNPDVLVIQEYWKIFSKTGRTALSMLQQHFPYIHEQGGNSGYYGRCICSKYPISNYTVRTYTDNNQRYYDSCTISVKGTPITIVNTHLDLTQAKRNTEIQELIAYLQTQTRFIACGDYNTGITQTSASDESTDYSNNVKPFIDELFNTANFGSFGFFVTCNDGIDGEGTNWYLDNAYTSSNIAINNVQVDTTKLNDLINEKVDHMPLIAQLTIN